MIFSKQTQAFMDNDSLTQVEIVPERESALRQRAWLYDELRFAVHNQ